MRSTHVRRRINAPRARVYRALLDAAAISQWRVPDGMTCQIHELDPREGGAIRVSLTYEDPAAVGKSAARTDTYRGTFVRLVPDKEVVEVDEFETSDPSLVGAMTSTLTLTDIDGGTELVAVHDGVPPGVPLADNEIGWKMSLAKLAALVEGEERISRNT